jgi:hypothetical protein
VSRLEYLRYAAPPPAFGPDFPQGMVRYSLVTLKKAEAQYGASPAVQKLLAAVKDVFLLGHATPESSFGATVMEACATGKFGAVKAQFEQIVKGESIEALTGMRDTPAYRTYLARTLEEHLEQRPKPAAEKRPSSKGWFWPWSSSKKRPPAQTGGWLWLLKYAVLLLALGATGLLLVRAGAEGMETLASAAEGARRWLSSPGGGQCATTQRIDEKLVELESKQKESDLESRAQSEANAALLRAAIAQVEAEAAKKLAVQQEKYRLALEAQAEAFEQAEQKRREDFEQAEQRRRENFERAKQKGLDDLEKAKESVSTLTGATTKVLRRAGEDAQALKGEVMGIQEKVGAMEDRAEGLEGKIRAAEGKVAKVAAQAKLLETAVQGLQGLVRLIQDQLQLFLRPNGRMTVLSLVVVAYMLATAAWLVVDLYNRFWAYYTMPGPEWILVPSHGGLASKATKESVPERKIDFLQVFIDLSKLALFFAALLIVLQIIYWTYALTHATVVSPMRKSTESARAVGKAVDETLEAVGETFHAAKDFTGATLNDTKHNLERIGNASRKLLGF